MQYKNHRKLLSTLLKKSKENYYKNYLNNTKIICKGIKSIITSKNITSSVPRTILQGENLITNPYDIANIFNNYFSPVSDTAMENNQCSNSIFIPLTDSEEVPNVISTPSMNKSSGPNSIPYKTLNLLKKDISNNMQIYLISFFHQVFFHHYSK